MNIKKMLFCVLICFSLVVISSCFVSAGNWSSDMTRSSESGNFILWDMFENATSGYNTTLWNTSATTTATQDNGVYVQGTSSVKLTDQAGQDNLRFIFGSIPEIPIFDFDMRMATGWTSNYVFGPSTMNIIFGGFDGDKSLKCNTVDSGFDFAIDTWYHMTIIANDNGSGFYDVYVDGVIKCNSSHTLAHGNLFYWGDSGGDGVLNANYDNFTYANLDDAWSVTGFDPPTIDISTYNMTSATENFTAWRTNTSFPIPTRDTTPTITFSTIANAYCRIYTSDQNWTTMGVNRNCSTTGSTTHTCTLAAADALVKGNGYNTLYAGCIDSTLVTENVTSTSGPLNVSLDLYTVSGYVFNASSLAYPGATVVVADQDTNVIYGNTTSNSSGGWEIDVYSTNWTSWAFDPDNESLAAEIKHFITV